MSAKLNPGILIANEPLHCHSKAQERYIRVIFSYDTAKWDGWVPLENRRTGTHIESEDEIIAHLNMVYSAMAPETFSAWKHDQDVFWTSKPRAGVTKSFFDVLAKGGWKCTGCELPQNPNWARRTQDLKEFGYTLSTDTSRFCPHCGEKKTHLILLPIPRYAGNGNGYETWSPALRKRIIRILGGIDVYENAPSAHCLPDHKFPEARWDDKTKGENPDGMTDTEIRAKFQLLTNQRNQQKREMCRGCVLTSTRPCPFGIKFYYAGGERWDPNFPTKGKDAEKGCVGCGWYDIQAWRQALQAKIDSLG